MRVTCPKCGDEWYIVTLDPKVIGTEVEDVDRECRMELEQLCAVVACSKLQEREILVDDKIAATLKKSA